MRVSWDGEMSTMKPEYFETTFSTIQKQSDFILDL